MGGAATGRVAVVTGASRGIGRAIATRLAAEGADVAIVARSRHGGAGSRGSLEDTERALAGYGVRTASVVADLADPALDRAWIIDDVEAQLGPVDILVNNAASGGYRPFAAFSDPELRAILEVNVWAPWQLARRALETMGEQGRGWILNISSAAAVNVEGPPFPDTRPARLGSIYGSTKAMLNRWTTSLAAEVHGTGIAVNALAPEGAVATEGLQQAYGLADFWMEPLEAMAEAALALCTGEPDTLTGRVAFSLELLRELGRPVLDLQGRALVPGWQPADLDRVIEAQERAGRGWRLPASAEGER